MTTPTQEDAELILGLRQTGYILRSVANGDDQREIASKCASIADAAAARLQALSTTPVGDERFGDGEVADLLARLEMRTPSRRSYLYGEEGGKLVNPDGPTAAAIIKLFLLAEPEHPPSSVVKELVEVCKANIETLREQVRRCEQWGKSHHELDIAISETESALSRVQLPSVLMEGGSFKLGDRVAKRSGSSWTGRVVGFYSTSLTPVGYAVESENEPGSVQIYPEAALTDAPQPTPRASMENET